MKPDNEADKGYPDGVNNYDVYEKYADKDDDKRSGEDEDLGGQGHLEGRQEDSGRQTSQRSRR